MRKRVVPNCMRCKWRNFLNIQDDIKCLAHGNVRAYNVHLTLSCYRLYEEGENEQTEAT